MFESKITKIGELANKIFDEENLIILFYDDVPEDLHEISVLHNKGETDFELILGDIISINDEEYQVIDIGSKAKETMKTLGHCTLKFVNNVDESNINLPGEVILLGDKLKKLELGMKIKIIR